MAHGAAGARRLAGQRPHSRLGQRLPPSAFRPVAQPAASQAAVEWEQTAITSTASAICFQHGKLGTGLWSKQEYCWRTAALPVQDDVLTDADGGIHDRGIDTQEEMLSHLLDAAEEHLRVNIWSATTDAYCTPLSIVASRASDAAT